VGFQVSRAVDMAILVGAERIDVAGGQFGEGA
jgi:hypothetical protein